MRQFLPFALLLLGGFTFTACSKKADTTPGASSSAAPAAEGTAAATPAEDPGITFNLSGGSPSAASTGSLQAVPAANASDYQQPHQVTEIYPFYPLSLRMRGIEGRVDVQITIDTEGRVASADVFRATEERFIPYALAAVRTARFAPAREKGQAVQSTAIFPVPFVSELGSGRLPSDSILARIAYLDGLYYMKDASGKMMLADTKEPIRLSIITAYPSNAKSGETLKARVKVSINDEGQVTSVTVTDASSSEFAEALKEVALFWQFIPQLKAGKPMTSQAIEFPLTVKVPGPAPAAP